MQLRVESVRTGVARLPSRIGHLLGCTLLLGAIGFVPTGCGDTEEDVGLVPGEPDDGSGEPAPAPVLMGTIGPEGGELLGEPGSFFEGVRVVIPPDAVVEATEFRVEGTVDGTPLPETAAAIGQQFVLLPANLEFAAPIEVTVPFDPAARAAWETPDEECKVWYRDGDGWARAEQIDSTPETVTVELPATTTFAPGVLTVPLSTGCRFNCATATPGPTCLDGDRFCMTRLGTQHVSDQGDWYSYTKGVLYWLHSPSSGNFALAGFDTLLRTPTTTTNTVNVSGAGPTGEVVVDRNGARWIGFLNRGNVMFEGNRLGTVFDSFATSTEPRAIGMGFDPSLGVPIRFRATVVPGSGGVGMGQLISAVRNGQVNSQLLMRVALSIDGVLQIGRATTATTGNPVLVWSRTNGVAFAPLPAQTAFSTVAPMGCAGQPMREVIGVAVSPGRFGWAMLCLREDNRGAMIVNGSTRATFDVGQTPRGKLAVDGSGTAFLADMSRAQIIRFALNGAATVDPALIRGAEQRRVYCDDSSVDSLRYRA
jgi:hypothetical protein